MLGLNYRTDPPASKKSSTLKSSTLEHSRKLDSDFHSEFPAEQSTRATGRVAQYANGARDYHDVIHDRLKRWIHNLRLEFPSNRFRGVVDSAPLLERDYAMLAGLGWIGKNTLLIHPTAGSYFFLAALLTDLELDVDQPWQTDHCGTCTACLDACPTSAFVGPHVLDARKCISYQTIENSERIPESIAANHGSWIFGCDICQEVCPWNRKPSPTLDPDFIAQEEMHNLDLRKILEMREPEFRTHFRKTPFWRTRLTGLQRNAMIVAANEGLCELGSAIADLKDSPDSAIRDTATWALEKLQHWEKQPKQ